MNDALGTAAHVGVGRLLCLGDLDGLEKRHWRLNMESNEQLDEIMKCSKEAIARAYMCHSDYSECPVGTDNCPYKRGTLCVDVTPQDWEKVLNERN